MFRPMEDFWDILKRESYYGRCLTSKKTLLQNYIIDYNMKQIQPNLGALTSLEKRQRRLILNKDFQICSFLWQNRNFSLFA